MRRYAILVGLFASATAWSMNLTSCCRDEACENSRFLNSQISMNYELCCQRPEGDRQACLNTLQEKANATLVLILTAKQACDNRDDELVKDTVKKIRDTWLPTIVKGASGLGLNQMIAFGPTDYIDLSTTLARQGGLDSRTYSFGGTPGAVRFGQVLPGIKVSGEISLVKTSEMPVEGTADVGVPSAAVIVGEYMGRKLTLTLDTKCEYNTLRVDNMGRGTLGMALTLSSKDSELLGLVQVGSAIYFAIPVTLAPNWSSLSIELTPQVPGSQITPTVAQAIAVDTMTPLNAPVGDPCDMQEAPMRDGARATIGALMSPLGCPQKQH
jgi:hypothetical protein